MNAAQIRETVMAVLRQWPLYEEDGHLQVHAMEDKWSIMYCGKCDVRPFSGQMFMAEKPPNYLMLEWQPTKQLMYLLFIQLLPEYRGKGYGDHLYRVVIEIGKRLGCREIRQTPSGGSETESRALYLCRRGWQLDGDEVYWRFPGVVNEADEIGDEDLEAAADMWDSIVSGQYAKEDFKIEPDYGRPQ